MKKYNEQLANIFVDIDDTLTPDLGETFFEGAIEKLISLSEKANIIVWSKGELSYIYEIVDKSGLSDYVSMCIPKPSLMIDDLSVGEFSGVLNISNGDWSRMDLSSSELESDWFEDSEYLRAKYKV